MVVPPGPPPPELKNFIEPALFSLTFLPIQKKAQLKALIPNIAGSIKFVNLKRMLMRVAWT